MSYQVLARKWRPQDFTTMVGQEHILRMLSNALSQKRLHHAYLFTGTRGVGKTTLARILAKCLNCETQITATPCGTCFACQAIDQGKFLDLYEIDAASRTKVEDTRELLDSVLYPPTQGRYKIYLIDEVHMLSNHSFNALLKTLEEPPEHVKFLLATTDPKRLPITILSRCLQFHLKRITPEQITQHLKHISTVENIPFELAALEKLAYAADGSMRDALSLLDQAIAYGEGHIKKADVVAMLGSMSQDDILPLLQALAAKDGKALIEGVRELAERGPDFQQALEEMITLLHQIALIQVVPHAILIDETLKALAQKLSAEEVQLYYQIALLSRRDLSLSPSPQLGFEMGLLRMLAFKPEIGESKEPNITPKNKPEKIIAKTQMMDARQVEKKAEITAESAITLADDWRNILPKLELSGMAFALASNCHLKQMDNNKVELVLSTGHHPMLNAKLKERIQDALTRYFKKPMQLNISTTTTELVTPHKQYQQEHEQQLASAKSMMLEDPHVKQMIERYDATVEISLAN